MTYATPVAEDDGTAIINRLAALRLSGAVHPQMGFDQSAWTTIYALRDALRSLDSVCGYLQDSAAIRDRVNTLGPGISADGVRNYLLIKRQQLTDLKAGIELQLTGRAS